MPELPPLYPDMTVREYLSFAAEIKGVARAARPKAVDQAMEKLQLTDVRGRLVKNLSKGYKQRVGVAQALVANPPVLILDEPTIGLDPQQIIETRTLIRSLGHEHTVILSSHILPEIAAVCDRVLIINRGKIVASDTTANLSRGLSGESRLAVRAAGPEREVLAALRAVANVRKVESLGSRESGTVDASVEAPPSHDIRRGVFEAMAKAGYPILSMRSQDLTLEEIFLNLITREREDD
jgi:ABC-2 type transport system ATP-binding protein